MLTHKAVALSPVSLHVYRKLSPLDGAAAALGPTDVVTGVSHDHVFVGNVPLLSWVTIVIPTNSPFTSFFGPRQKGMLGYVVDWTDFVNY